MQIWRTTRSSPGTSYIKARLVSLWCFGLTVLFQISLTCDQACFFLFFVFFLEPEHYLLHVSLSGRNATQRNLELIYRHSFPLAREREKIGRTWEQICRWWVCLGCARQCPKSVAQGLGGTESVNSDRLLFTELDGKNHQCFKIYTATGVWKKFKQTQKLQQFYSNDYFVYLQYLNSVQKYLYTAIFKT